MIMIFSSPSDVANIAHVLGLLASMSYYLGFGHFEVVFGQGGVPLPGWAPPGTRPLPPLASHGTSQKLLMPSSQNFGRGGMESCGEYRKLRGRRVDPNGTSRKWLVLVGQNFGRGRNAHKIRVQITDGLHRHSLWGCQVPFLCSSLGCF